MQKMKMLAHFAREQFTKNLRGGSFWTKPPLRGFNFYQNWLENRPASYSKRSRIFCIFCIYIAPGHVVFGILTILGVKIIVTLRRIEYRLSRQNRSDSFRGRWGGGRFVPPLHQIYNILIASTKYSSPTSSPLGSI